jgi:hypothetical protein
MCSGNGRIAMWPGGLKEFMLNECLVSACSPWACVKPTSGGQVGGRAGKKVCNQVERADGFRRTES